MRGRLRLKALITGVTGFIGSHVAEHLLLRGDEVAGVGRTTWHANAPQGLTDRVELLSWDIQSPPSEQVRDRVEAFNPEVIYHFAGISIPAQCGADSPTPQALAVNVGGTRHVLDLAQRLDNPKVVFASTCHVYDHVSAANPFVTEDSPIKPISAYGQTKLASEEEIHARVRAGQLDACIVRGFHHIGPRQPSGLMLTDWLEQLADPMLQELHVRSTNSYLDLVDVRDAAVAYRTLAERGAVGRVYNLGSGRISRSGDVLTAILEDIGRQPDIVVRSIEERWNTIADVTRLADLGWLPKIEYLETVRDMLRT